MFWYLESFLLPKFNLVQQNLLCCEAMLTLRIRFYMHMTLLQGFLVSPKISRLKVFLGPLSFSNKFLTFKNSRLYYQD